MGDRTAALGLPVPRAGDLGALSLIDPPAWWADWEWNALLEGTRPVSKIQEALNGAMRDIAAKGIAKLNSANLGGASVKFRGVEQAMNELSPIMVNHGITVAPRYSELVVEERAKFENGQPTGKAVRFATVKGSFTFTAGDDSSVTSEAYGEAMDSGDKAIIKAQSVAFRTALFQLFVVPTMSMDTELDDFEDEPQEEQKKALTPAATKAWAAAKEAYRRDGDLDNVLKFATLTEAHRKQLIAEADETHA
jgi:hypothetical protein